MERTVTPPPLSFEGLIALVQVLRSEEGCPWDRQQTPEQIKTYLLKEAYELLMSAPVNFVGNVEGRDLAADRADVIVANLAAGLEDEPITLEDIERTLAGSMDRVRVLIDQLLNTL